ncbi:MAG: hypothetical protein ACFFAY_02200 [Promethearchaeota archaeon]
MKPDKVHLAIVDMVDKETLAWNTQNVDLLLSIFHPDMVWPWPKDAMAHDPMDWVLELGKFDYDRWGEAYRKLFDTHTLIHNHRILQKVVTSKEGDGGFAVVDIDTLWRDPKGNENHWKGRVCKVYTKVGLNEWKLIMHTGALEY